jgi:hypothetical protein
LTKEREPGKKKSSIFGAFEKATKRRNQKSFIIEAPPLGSEFQLKFSCEKHLTCFATHIKFPKRLCEFFFQLEIEKKQI